MMTMRRFLSLFVALVMFGAAPVFAQDVKPVDMTPATLNVGFFGKNIMMLAAADKGFFAAQNLTVNFLQIASSEQAFTDLRDGRYDIILSSIDNVVNYRLNPHNFLGATQPVQAFMAVDYSNHLTLTGRVGIPTVEDLRGKTVAVDAVASGFAYVAYEILSNHGLQRNVDYNVTSIGGGLGRFLALTATPPRVDATLLNNGLEIRAAARGATLFESVFDIVPSYLGSVGVAMEPWMEANPDVLIRFIRAYVAAGQWAQDPANYGAALAETQAQPGFASLALAKKALDAQFVPGQGIVFNACIGDLEREGLANVLFLRQKYDGFELPQNLKKLATPAGGLYNLHWYHQAVGDTVSCD